MATERQSHQEKRRLHKPMAYQFPTGTAPTIGITPAQPGLNTATANTAAPGVDINNYQQLLRNQTAQVLPIYDLQSAFMQTTANRQIEYQLYLKQFGDVTGALNIGANPIVPPATNYGVGNFS